MVILSGLSANSLVDEVHGLRLELVGTVQVGQDEDLSSVLHRQTGTERILTHDLQSLQCILKPERNGDGEPAAGNALLSMLSLQKIRGIEMSTAKLP